jgi:acetyl-CoA carboxylase carboxyltransferase component
VSSHWQERLDEIAAREVIARGEGREAAIARRHAAGLATARESVSSLADPNSFREIGALAGTAVYDGPRLKSFAPADTVIGTCTVNGRPVAVMADDVTADGPHADTNAAYKSGYAQKVALDWQMPFVRILDSLRRSALEFERAGRSYLHDQDSADEALRLLDSVPVATAVVGPAQGLHAVEAALSHFTVGIEGVTVSLAGDAPARQPGDAGGLVHNYVSTSDEALTQVRQFLSYLPSSVWEPARRAPPVDDPDRRDERLLSVIPEARNRLYNPYVILEGVLDAGSIFEVGTSYGKACITALARVNGYPVGVLAKNPRSASVGAMDSPAGDKAIRLIQLCDTFHLPLVYFVDEPGFMIGVDAQRTGIVRNGARLVLASVESRMPYITFLVRQVYGVAGTLFTRGQGMYKHYAWVSANWGGMHIEGGTTAAYRRDIESAPDPAARQAEIENMLWMLSSPFRSLEAFEVDDLIDPRDSRRLLCEFVEAAQPVIATQLGPTQGPAFRP